MIKTQPDFFRRIRCASTVTMLLIGFWSAALPVLHAQNAPFSTRWAKLEAKIDQPDVDTSYQFILDEVKSYCGSDVNCLILTYDTIQGRLERKFKMDAAIKVTTEIIRLAEEQGAVKKMAQGHSDLFRYFDAVNNAKASSVHLDLALKYYQDLGDKSKIILCSFRKIIGTSYSNEETKQKLEPLINEAIAEKDSLLAGSLLSVMFPLTIPTDRPEEIEARFAMFERMMKPFTKKRSERRCWAVFWEEKGNYMQKNGDLNNAKVCYEKALEFLKLKEDDWLKINVILFLVDTDWKLGNRKEAKSGLEHAFVMSEEIKSDDLFVRLYSAASQVAEGEGRFADALLYQKKMNAAQARVNETGDLKISRNYYLEVENKNKALELKQSADRLISTIIISILALLLAAGLSFGFYKQRKSRRELAAQNALIQAQAEQLKTLDEAKSRFFANVSHELRTPLTLLTSPIKTLLKENQLTPKQTQLLHMAERSGQQLGQLINEILDLRKLDMGKMTVSTAPTELYAFFQICFAQFESLAEQKQIDYSLSSDIPDNTVAVVDREKCRQILFNLLSNAFKFTPAAGKINARIQLIGPQLQLSVTDSGAGIHPDDLPHIFDRYFQSSRPGKPAEGGTGIGLALCREYALLFGGAIHAESTPGHGTTVTVAFPVQISPAAAQDLILPPSPDSSTQPAEKEPALLSGGVSPATSANKSKILIVEDNPDLREYIGFVLRDKYEVVAAEHGSAAWSLLKESKTAADFPDLILSDLMMPVMDGYQLLAQLKSDDATSHIPVIMLTARAETQDKLKALRIGVDDYLTKPFDEEELLARIENLLRNQLARRAAMEAATGEKEEQLRPAMSQPDREWLETFEAYIQKHYSSDILSVTSIAHAFAMSESTLLRQLKRLTGLSPLQYIQEVRLNETRRLLEVRAYNSISQVAAKVGYDDARSFARSFRQRFGKLPSEMMEG